jgi:DNA-binding response OmpR family regulator
VSGGARILVVDDQRDILDLASAVLAAGGYAVTTTPSGVEALELLAGEPFDLVLLDINMPQMDGWETLRLIRADELLTGLPVVMFSVKNEMHDKVHGMQEGAQDYIAKPFEVDELLSRVRRVIDSVTARGAGPSQSGVER